MRITLDNTYYHKPVNLPVKLRDRLLNALPEPFAWAIVFVMFFWLARLALRAIE